MSVAVTGPVHLETGNAVAYREQGVNLLQSEETESEIGYGKERGGQGHLNGVSCPEGEVLRQNKVEQETASELIHALNNRII